MSLTSSLSLAPVEAVLNDVWSTCEWIPTNANTANEVMIGSVDTPAECLEQARTSQYGCEIANLPDGDGSGTCWCQYGSDTTVDASGYRSCWLEGTPSPSPTPADYVISVTTMSKNN